MQIYIFDYKTYMMVGGIFKGDFIFPYSLACSEDSYKKN